MEAAGACIYTDIYGRRAIAIDKPQENALAVYNPQNIISIQNKKTFGRQTDGLRIKYVNSKDDLYQEDTYLLMREVNGKPLELTPDSIIKDINITGITTFKHIVKYARRLMAIEALRPKTTIIEVGNEGVFYTPYSKILIQDDSLKIGIGKGYQVTGTKWWGGLLKKIYINEPLTFDPMKTYGIIVNCFTETGVQPVAIKVDGKGSTKELTALTNIRASADAKPDTGCLFSFGEIDIDGEFSKISTPYIISQIKRSDKGFNLELVNYNEAIYSSGKIPDYKSNITQKAIKTTKPIPLDIITSNDLAEAIAEIDPAGSNAAQEAADVVTHGVHFTNVHKIRDVEMSLSEVIAKMDSDQNKTSASIQMSEEEILLKVEDMENELVGILDIQAGSIQAIVEGGGASGRMSLSLELPAMIDAATRAKFVKASREEDTARVYAKLDGTDYYAIRGDVSEAAAKLLWEKAIKASILASQIVLDADQINIAGMTVFSSRKTENLTTTAQRNAEITSAKQRNKMAQNLGYSSYDDMTRKAAQGQTIIDGGFLRTALIDVDELITKKLHIDTDKNSNQDFEVDINEDIGISVRYKGQVVFEVSKTGNAIFSGDIITPPFELIQGVISPYNLTYNNELLAEIIRGSKFAKNNTIPFLGSFLCSGTYQNKNVKRIEVYLKKESGTKTYYDKYVNVRYWRGSFFYKKGNVLYKTTKYILNIFFENGDKIEILEELVDKDTKSITTTSEEQRWPDGYLYEFEAPDSDVFPSLRINSLIMNINNNATTMRLKGIPLGDGNYERGTVYDEDGFLKIKR